MPIAGKIVLVEEI